MSGFFSRIFRSQNEERVLQNIAERDRLRALQKASQPPLLTAKEELAEYQKELDDIFVEIEYSKDLDYIKHRMNRAHQVLVWYERELIESDLDEAEKSVHSAIIAQKRAQLSKM